VSWRHSNNQALQGPIDNTVKGAGHFMVVGADYRGWPDVPGKVDKVCPRRLLRLQQRKPQL
jgi:hypothetical protein